MPHSVEHDLGYLFDLVEITANKMENVQCYQVEVFTVLSGLEIKYTKIFSLLFQSDNWDGS